MKSMELIRRAEMQFAKGIHSANVALSSDIFSNGAEWMHHQMNVLRSNEGKIPFDSNIDFRKYGVLKYAVSLTPFIISIYILGSINIFLIPLSVVVFYFAEVQFLFLFPLLIDSAKHPLWESIRMTYRIGIINAVITVLPIGVFMVFGLLNLKDPYRNWYLGCLAITIWYNDEIAYRKKS